MTHAMRDEPIVGTRRGYGAAASSGTRWTTAQALLNKLATAVGMVLVARALEPSEYGLAIVVMIAHGFVALLPVLVMGDVLISHQHHLRLIARPAAVVTMWATVGVVLLSVATAPLIAGRYEHYPYAEMTALLALCALRPIGDALTVFPMTRLRIELRYREIAVVSGLCQFGGTLLTVTWALVWPSAAAIVIPQALWVIARAAWLSVLARGSGMRHPGAPRLVSERRPGLAVRLMRRLQRDFVTAAAAQYVHTVVGGLALLTASLVVSDEQTGQLSFAIMLAGQSLTIISSQLAVVLQPIFGKLKIDTARRMNAFMRVLRMMTAVTVPLSLLQAALALPLIRLFFGEKWIPAAPMFVAICVGQANIFALGPTMAMLKAQGRFGTNLAWQAVHGLVCVLVLPGIAIHFGAIGVAWVDSIIWSISLVVGVMLAVRGTGVSLVAVIKAFTMPWLTAAPIAVAAWLASHEMPGPPLIASAAALLLVGPLAMGASILAVRISQPDVAAEMAPFMGRILPRIPIIGGPLARWFCGADAGRDETARLPDRESLG